MVEVKDIPHKIVIRTLAALEHTNMMQDYIMKNLIQNPNVPSEPMRKLLHHVHSIEKELHLIMKGE